MGKFDIKRDKQFPYFCEACLVGKREDEMSGEDIRYCVGCQQVIEESYSLSADTGSHLGRYTPQEQAEKVAPMEMDIGKEKMKMSTLNQNIATVDIKRAGGRIKPRRKRELPEGLIKQLSEGMGSKAVASKLKRDKGIDVSYKTIQRLLAGER